MKTKTTHTPGARRFEWIVDVKMSQGGSESFGFDNKRDAQLFTKSIKKMGAEWIMSKVEEENE